MSPARRPPRSARSRPFAGRRIAVTRPRAQAGDLVRALEALGAEVVAAPTIRIRPLPDAAPVRAALAALSRYDWLIFTSRNAVDVVCDRLPDWGLAVRDLARVRIAAIGPGTAAALARHGLTPALVPGRFVAEAVVAALAERGPLAGQRVLLPRAREARDALPAGLRALGAQVDVIPVYETVRAAADGAALARAILGRELDAITFTSSSTVRHFVDIVGPAAATSGRFAAAVIGPVTAATARELGIAVAIEAAEYSVPGLVDALRRYFGPRRRGKRGRGGTPTG
ncbi:MAG TPA: uroporphyrinogen-III synthase [Gemmatimonadales bacterium]|nr:uroporphyrinogen-III synthase [Gemmatimonadales bacterium]